MLLSFCAIGFSDIFAIDASATDPIDVQLTYEQTLALYGSTIQVDFYNGSTNVHKSAYFYDYTDNLGDRPSHWDNIYFTSISANTSGVPSCWRNTPGGLVYYVPFTVDEFHSGSYSDHANIYLDTSVDITGLTRYRHNIFYQVQYSLANYTNTYGLYNTTYSNSIKIYPDHYYAGFERNRTGNFPTYCYNSNDQNYSGVDETKIAILSGIFADLSNNDDTFSLDTETYTLNGCYVLDLSGRTINDTYYVNGYGFFFIITCPILTGVDPTIVTTAVSSSGSETTTTTAVNVNVDVDVDVDLSTVESQLDEIIDNQESEISQLEDINESTLHTWELVDGMYTTQTAQLNDILDKLDDIYDQMVLSGQVIVNLDIDSSLSTQTNALISGIRNLFIPSQQDIITFRVNLQNELQSLFPAAFTSKESIATLFHRFSSVEEQNRIWFPGVSTTFTDTNGQDTVFSIDGQYVELKPRDDQNGFHALYEAAALAVDMIATILFYNMLRNRFESMLKNGGD